MRTTPEDRERLARLAEAASAGPTRTAIIEPPIEKQAEHLRLSLEFGSGPVWGVGLPEHPRSDLGADPDRPNHMVMVAYTGNGPTSEANAEFFAVAREGTLALLSDLAEVEGENARLRKVAEAADRLTHSSLESHHSATWAIQLPKDVAQVRAALAELGGAK